MYVPAAVHVLEVQARGRVATGAGGSRREHVVRPRGRRRSASGGVYSVVLVLHVYVTRRRRRKPSRPTVFLLVLVRMLQGHVHVLLLMAARRVPGTIALRRRWGAGRKTSLGWGGGNGRDKRQRRSSQQQRISKGCTVCIPRSY